MSLKSAPFSGSVTVSKQLAEYYNKSITDFTDTGDVTCIEITAVDVSLNSRSRFTFMLTICTEGKCCSEGVFSAYRY